MLSGLIVVVLLAPAAASAAPAESWAGAGASGFESALGFRPDLGALRLLRKLLPRRRAQEPAVIPLPSVLGDMGRKSGASFTANGRIVRVSGTKARNTGEWFLGFLDADGNEWWYKGRKALRYPPFFDRHLIVPLHGALFDVQVHGDLGDKLDSAIVVRPARLKRGKAMPVGRRPDEGEVEIEKNPVGRFSIRDMTRSSFDAGWPVKLDREYRLLYTEDFLESSGGEFGGFSGERSLALLYEDRAGKLSAYHWFLDEIPAGTPGLAIPETQDGVDKGRPGSTFFMRLLPDGSLEMSYAGPPAPGAAFVSPNGRPPRK